MIDDIGEKSDHDGKMQRPHPRSFPTRKTGFQQLEGKLQKRIIRQQRSLEVIRNHALGLFPNFEQSLVADVVVAWLHQYDHIVNPSTTASLADRKCTSSCANAN